VVDKVCSKLSLDAKEWRKSRGLNKMGRVKNDIYTHWGKTMYDAVEDKKKDNDIQYNDNYHLR